LLQTADIARRLMRGGELHREVRASDEASAKSTQDLAAGMAKNARA